jgi:uncharacterized membrane protein YgdD (TMEM256/DUF423 family)
MNPTFWIRAGALLGGLAVAAGAFGAHGLKQQISAGTLTEERLQTFEIAVRYQMYHALALLAVGLIARSFVAETASKPLSVAGWSFLVGTLIFSGTLYALVLSGQKWLGAITPIGGVLQIVGWVALAMALRRGT